MKRKIELLLAFLLLSISCAFAQKLTVKGTVLDETGETIIGATVREKGVATNGASTDMDGHFTLTVNQGATIIVSYVGYKTQEVKAAAQLTIKMLPDNELLDEVVVIGYGTRAVANTSASLVKVNSKDLQEKPSANILDAVQGKVSGVQVLTSSGEPSEISSVHFHGVGSLTAGSAPLYILDGMPVSVELIQTLNPNDFESMQFLKDAAATSIYGARAANGVIYITTKRGKMSERANISVRGQYGVSSLANVGYYDKLMNTNELLSFYESIGDTDLAKKLRDQYGNNDTQWWKYYYQQAPMHQEDISISGGSANTNYYFSLGYLDQQGIRAGSQYSKISTRLNVNSTLNDYVKIGVNTSVSYGVARVSPESFGLGETYAALATMLNPPFYTPYKEDGSEYFDEPIPGLGIYNPKYHMTKDTPTDHNLYVNTVGSLTLTPFENFQIRSNVGIEIGDYTRDRLRRPSWVKLAGNGTNSKQFSRDLNFTTNNVAEYKFSVADDHHFITLLGQEYVRNRYNFFSAFGKGLTDDRLSLLKHVTKEQAVDENWSEYAFLSFFGQFSYDYDSKYFLDLVLRNDASSRFGANKRNGTFWSAGLLWKAKKEDFLKDVAWLDVLDFRLSYGTQGNAAIGNYSSVGTVKASNQYKGAPGWGMGNVPNPDLTWESQDQFTVGFTADMFERLHLNLEFYNRVTRDMLMEVPQPYTSGLLLDDMDFASMTMNAGSLLNRGFDLALTADLLQGKDYGISAYVNLNYNKNKILELFQGRDQWILPGYGFGYIVGQEIPFIYPIYKDVDPKTGKPRWYLPATDKDGNPDKTQTQMDPNKVTSDFDESGLEQNTGKPRYPHWNGGFGFNANWRGISLQADFAFVLDKWMIANESLFTKNPIWFFGQNTEKEAMNYWKQEGDIASYPSIAYQEQEMAHHFDTSLLSDASFLRLKNLTLGYEFQKSLLSRQSVLTGLKIYGTARNILTFTKFEGIDPEVNSNLSFHVNPNTKQFVVGIEASF